MLALIVDANSRHATSLAQSLKIHGFRSQIFERPSDVSRVLVPGYDIAFIALDAHGEDGLALLTAPCLEDAVEIVLMNEQDDAGRVTLGMRQGASYFFQMPFDPEFVESLASDVAEELSEEHQGQPIGKNDPGQIDQFALLRGGSKKMRRLYRTMRKVAQQDTSVFIVGESGTGKDLVAQSLHLLGPRSAAEFVAMNCAAVPSELFESELFGHEKGSFSGAVSQHPGIFERADGGTLFLDEITEMPAELQAKLLRALDGSSFRRVGGESDISSNVRVLASTNRSPEAAIREGQLREDLYFRLASLVLRVPPLRARDEDKLGLAHHFLRELNEEHDTSKVLSQAACDRISGYHWPGNVRELKGTIERAHILSSGDIDLQDLGEFPGTDASAQHDSHDLLNIHSGSTIAEAEEALIHAALKKFKGNKTNAAKSLGISLKTLYNRLKAYERNSD